MSRLPDRQLTNTSIYRICTRCYEPFHFRDWSAAGSDGTFGYRWDDPRSKYRVIYSAQERTGAFMETLQRFIPPADLVALRASIAYNDADGPASIEPYIVPREWADERILGMAKVSGKFAAVHLAKALQYFRVSLASSVSRLGFVDFDFDLSAILLRAPRELSQAASRAVYDDSEAFGGIVCLSRMGYEFTNVTIFEEPDGSRGPVAPMRASLTGEAEESIAHTDPSLLEALSSLNLSLG